MRCFGWALAFGFVGLALVPVAQGADERVAVWLKFLERELVALRDVVADIFHPHFGLSCLDFDAAAFVLELRESLTHRAKAGIHAFCGLSHLGALGKKGAEFRLLFGEFRIPLANRNFERSIFCS